MRVEMLVKDYCYEMGAKQCINSRQDKWVQEKLRIFFHTQNGRNTAYL